ncbi:MULTISPECIES: aldo/keto reductase [unclassified Roseitalea]|uniref:aldo/keto reductase n=1 Tax=unclassified Roseitalea TaxID=2639107 RepID=UPI00273FFE05|nr:MULTISPECIES: aldo/keto reductase [unclassified Roseitalea]
MDITETRPIGTTELRLPTLGVGANPLGGLYEPVPAETVAAIVDRAFDRGVTFFDLAPVYGYGNAERFVGAALKDRPRDSFRCTTKVGRLLLDPDDPATPAGREDVMVLWQGEQLYKGTDPVRPYFDFSRDGVMRSLEASLERTGLDRFDALHIHDPDLHPDEAIDEAFRALSDLKSEGVIGAIGCGMNQWEMLADFANRADFDCFLLAGRYSLLDQSALPDLLPACEKSDISLIVGGVYNSGILSHPDPASIRDVSTDSAAIPSWTGNVTFNYVPASPEIVDKAAAIKRVCNAHGTSLMAAAIQFPLYHRVVASVLMGPRTPDHVDGNVDAFTEQVPDAVWSDLKAEGLLPAEAPTP